MLVQIDKIYKQILTHKEGSAFDESSAADLQDTKITQDPRVTAHKLLEYLNSHEDVPIKLMLFTPIRTYQNGIE
jgi:hypothetical protein